jgi:hypothetical protein
MFGMIRSTLSIEDKLFPVSIRYRGSKPQRGLEPLTTLYVVHVAGRGLQALPIVQAIRQ